MLKSLSFYKDRLSTPRWKLVLLIFLIGLCMRMVVFAAPHYEGDELIYTTLVLQLDTGKG